MNIFIACSKSKLNYPCEAQEIYTASAIFNKRMLYAKNLKKIYDEDIYIYILSAKYGLLQLTDKIEPYECFLGKQSKEYRKNWQNKVLNQMKSLNINFNDKTYFATGEEYWKLLINNFTNVKTEKEMVIKTLNRGGIGMAMKYYDLMNNNIKKCAISDNPHLNKN